MKAFSVFGIPVYSGTYDGVLGHIASIVHAHKKGYVCVTGVHGLMESQRTPDVQRAHTRASLVVPDGMPVVWVGKAQGLRETHRIYGPDLFLKICEVSQAKKWTLFLYGTTGPTLRLLTKQLAMRFPKLSIVGSYAPPFRELTDAEAQTIIRSINAKRPTIVLVGLSTPKQELWMYTHQPQLNANILIGVGAAFDFIAGTKKQAPRWMGNHGLEWLFRLLQEPERLWFRYFRNNFEFIGLLTLSLIKHSFTNKE